MESLSPPIGIEKGIRALEAWLRDQRYSQHCIERIVAQVDAEGTPSGCPELDPEDEEGATETFIEAMPAVCVCDPAWDEYATEPGRGPRYGVLPFAGIVPPDLVEDGDEYVSPYEPSEEDWKDYHAWSVEAEARRLGILPIGGGSPAAEAEADPIEAQREWYRRHPLSEFNAIRPDSDGPVIFPIEF